MKQEDKQLLLKDLCARLRYGIMINYPLVDEVRSAARLTGISEDGLITLDIPIEVPVFNIMKDDIKPYLRPMSSMTEEEHNLLINLFDIIYNPKAEFYLIADFYNQRMLDYRNLIKQGLALEAPKGMYKLD